MGAEYMFGVGPGHLSARVERAAAELGAGVVNHTDAQCLCGRGCRPFTCKRSRRHWLTVPNMGTAEQHAKRVMAALADQLPEVR